MDGNSSFYSERLRGTRERNLNPERFWFMCFRVLLIFLILTITATTHAQNREGDLAVLDIRKGTELPAGINVELLSKFVREVAVKTTSYRVMTKENVFAILHDKGIDPNKCDEVECEVEFGRVLQADKLVVGELSFIDGIYYLTLSMYDTPTAAIDNTISRECSGCSFNDLIKLVTSTSEELFGFKKGVEGEKEIGEKPREWKVEETEEVIAKFESEPSGAMVEISGEPVCETPCSRILPAGEYRVEIKKPGYLRYEDSIIIKKGMAPVIAKLKPNFGWLTVNSEPEGLDVFLNKEKKGKTPLSRLEVPPGRYEILVTDPRYYEAGKIVDIGMGEEKTVALKLRPKEGAIKVRAYDEKGNTVEGEVFVDGSKMGNAPGTFKVIIGWHEIKVRTKEGAEWNDKISVEEGRTILVEAKIKPVKRKPFGLFVYPVVNYYVSEIYGMNYGAGVGYKLANLIAFGAQFTTGKLSKDGLDASASFGEIYSMMGYGKNAGGYFKLGINYQGVSGNGRKKTGVGIRGESGLFIFYAPICLFAGGFTDITTSGILFSFGGYF